MKDSNMKQRIQQLTDDELYEFLVEADEALSHMGDKAEDDYLWRDIISEEINLRRANRLS